MKVKGNRSGCIRHLISRAAFNSGKIDTITINALLIDLSYMVYIVYVHDFIHGKFNGTVNTKNGKLVINGKAIFIFRECDPAKWGDAGTE
ncbi:Glyceraldehyde-3-phosphate dehydrogenase [Heterocephalus glaber]|uniref:glyceraldehyde-3-phosphate dehydrogenase (phosphorylating) n=1 Tax=Heterocephalus glaber TaxID=10181 RepID=G5C605_HETGA|nr:Glyceraldehyde-3-phosphate dehydrogenase [Heterocephalus glaber]